MLKTSQSHPLQIAEVRVASQMGRIGVTFCPGKVQRSAMTGNWQRDLGVDLDAIRDWGAAAVVTLVDDEELKTLEVEALGKGVAERHMAWRHLPIRDYSTPDEQFERRWRTDGAFLRGLLRREFDIVVHCKGGLGRAGTVSARLLVELGWNADAAIAAIRGARPGAIENLPQEMHVRSCGYVTEREPERSQSAKRDRALGALVGLAVGDAVGTTLEFHARDSYVPLTDMVGGGPFDLEPGQWTDDTAMALALADSLILCGGLDPAHLMGSIAEWMEHGTWSCTGECFDIGRTTHDALRRWQKTGEPLAGSVDPRTAGNGSLMRLAPVALRYGDNPEFLGEVAARQSLTTHGAPTAVAACQGFAVLLSKAIAGGAIDQVLAPNEAIVGNAEIAGVLAGSWRGRHRRDIRGSGYVVESLEASLWCVARAGSFEEAVLTAANLGDDADTTAAIAGQLAGAIWGLESIPERWRARLAWHDRILATGDALLEAR